MGNEASALAMAGLGWHSLAMTRLQKLIAWLGAAISFGLLAADIIDRARRVHDAPGTVLTFWRIVRKMLDDFTWQATVVLVIGTACLVVATSGWWLPRIRQLFSGAVPSGHPPVAIEPDLSIAELLRGLIPYPIDDAPNWRPVLEEVRGKAAGGHVRLWGERMVRANDGSWVVASPVAPIPATYWSEGQLDLSAIWSGKAGVPQTGPLPHRLFTGLDGYASLMVNREEALKLWPTRLPSPEPTKERIGFSDFAKLARDQFGWKFGGDNAEEIDLRAALEQAHSDGDLVLEGLHGGITIYDALPRRFFSDGAHIEWAIGFPEVNNQHVVAWSATTAGTSKRELWSDLHLANKQEGLDWLRTPQADQYRGRTREAHFRDRRHWLGDCIRVGENLEAAARSGEIKGWAAKDVVGWEAEDVLGFLERRLWPSHVERFVAAGRPLTAEDAAGGDAVADLVHAKVAVLKDFLKEYS